jgi:hypothetical protein
MTDEDIIRMADMAGLIDYLDLQGKSFPIHILHKFSLLVARQEREECAKLCEVEHGFYGLAPSEDIRARSKEE